MKIAISGSSGLVGAALGKFLTSRGDAVHALVRRPVKNDREIFWDQQQGTIETGKLAGLDAVVHLGGEPIAKGRWTPAFKQRVLDSRVESTAQIAETLAGLNGGPRTLICASAIGYYGNRGEEQLSEQSASGGGFLGEVVTAWEQAADPARTAGLRVAHARIGMVMSREGGALRQMLPIFRFGLGGPAGSGRQWVSWIMLEDVVQALVWLLDHPNLSGPFNLVVPEPVRQKTFAGMLGKVLRRPAFLPAPAFMLKLLLGQMGEELLLGSQRVSPDRLLEAGFTFRHTDLEAALREALAAGSPPMKKPVA